ncbi:MAG: hypothetical protein LRY50_09050 [Geovibrio sp.]|nr:hypothetical protein [Geovibrio sp.]
MAVFLLAEHFLNSLGVYFYGLLLFILDDEPRRLADDRGYLTLKGTNPRLACVAFYYLTDCGIGYLNLTRS